MAIGLASNFVIRDELFNSVFEEKVTQELNVFNAASGGGLRLQTQAMEGDYGKRRFFDRLTGTNNRRDTTSVSAQTDTALTMDEIISVKRSRKFKTHAQTFDAWEKLGLNSTQMNVMLAQNYADEQIKDFIEASVISLKNAIGDSATAITDYSATGVMAHAALIDGLALFGDAAGDIKTWLGHSKVWFDLLDNSLSVSSGHVGPAAIYDAQIGTLNRPLVMTDSTNFIITGTPNDYVTFGLVEGACVITMSESKRFVADVVTGLENLVLRYQGEYAYNVEIKGHAWDTSTGSTNPTDATLGTSGNWDIKVGHIKNGPGIYVRTQ